MFHPMAFTVVAALLGAMILSMTFVPAAVALFLTGSVSEKENRLMGWAKRGYEPLLDKAMSRQPLVLTITGVSVALAVVVFRRRLHTFSKVHCTMANRRSLLYLLGSGIVQSMP